MEKQLYAGFGRVNVNPPMGIAISGYYVERLADGILNDLEVNVIALRLGEKTVLLINVDNCGLGEIILNEFRKNVSINTGVDFDAIFISATQDL